MKSKHLTLYAVLLLAAAAGTSSAYGQAPEPADKVKKQRDALMRKRPKKRAPPRHRNGKRHGTKRSFTPSPSRPKSARQRNAAPNSRNTPSAYTSA